ncbi:hypothetical protein [Photorhabdus aballayi]
MAKWKAFYNYHRPHSGLKGKTPYGLNVDNYYFQMEILSK